MSGPLRDPKPEVAPGRTPDQAGADAGAGTKARSDPNGSEGAGSRGDDFGADDFEPEPEGGVEGVARRRAADESAGGGAGRGTDVSDDDVSDDDVSDDDVSDDDVSDDEVSDDDVSDDEVSDDDVSDDEVSDDEDDASGLLVVVARERDDYLDSLRRLQADFENYKKRILRQQTEHLERAAEALVEKLLPVLDTADLALSHGSDSVAQVRAALTDALGREGLERIDPTDEPFDPNVADAVAHEPGEGGPMTVVEVLRAGYRWKGRVLRPAMVKVRG